MMEVEFTGFGRGTAFRTYAVELIGGIVRQAMRDALRRPIKQSEEDALFAQYGRAITNLLIDQSSNVRVPAEVSRMMIHIIKTTSIIFEHPPPTDAVLSWINKVIYMTSRIYMQRIGTSIRSHRQQLSADLSSILLESFYYNQPVEDRGLTEAAILALPRVRQEAVLEGQEKTDCAVCQEPMDEGQMLINSTVCTHQFHEECLLPWLSNHSTCPCCRKTMGEILPPTNDEDVDIMTDDEFDGELDTDSDVSDDADGLDDMVEVD